MVKQALSIYSQLKEGKQVSIFPGKLPDRRSFLCHKRSPRRYYCGFDLLCNNVRILFWKLEVRQLKHGGVSACAFRRSGQLDVPNLSPQSM